MAAHVDRHHVVVALEMRRQMIELMRHAADAVEHDKRRLLRRAPIQVMKPQSIHGYVAVLIGLRLGWHGGSGKRRCQGELEKAAPTHGIEFMTSLDGKMGRRPGSFSRDQINAVASFIDRMKRNIPLLLTLMAGGWLCAQSSKTFEAVSIKPNRSGAPGSDTNTTLGRLSLVNVTPISLILRAFGVQTSQVVNAPGWVFTERYDVMAVTEGAERLTDKERQPFIEAMLADRWQMKTHRETRELRVYTLTSAEGGPKIATAKGGEYAMKVSASGGKRVLRSTSGNIPRLVEILSGMTDRMVINATGLSGEYDFTLEWVQEPDADAAGPSLFTALKEQLGLKLESARKPVDVVVIDRIERPSEN